MFKYIGLRYKKRIVWFIGLTIFAMILVPASLSPAARTHIASVGADVESSTHLGMSEHLETSLTHSVLGDALTPHEANRYAPFVE